MPTAGATDRTSPQPGAKAATRDLGDGLDALLSGLLSDRRTLVVVGPGGVGKTTTSAALAVQAARMGLKVLVLTVDPAKRLANSLGLTALGNEEVRVEPAIFAKEGVRLGSGALYAMMLDTKRTFDDLIERHAPSPRVRDQIFANPFYAQASGAMAGSQEYMAMEKLYELRESRDYDLIVLDTPPTANALDFLSAPERLGDFLDSTALTVLLKGARTAGKLGLGLLRLNRLMLKGLDRFVGGDTFVNLLDFIESFQEMYAGFKGRAARVREILRGDDVAFVIVTSTEAIALDEALFLHGQLHREDMPMGAVMVNRVRQPFVTPGQCEGLGDYLRDRARDVSALKLFSPAHIEGLMDKVASACRDFGTLSTVDADRIRDLEARLGADAALVRTIPLFDQDIHSIGGLAEFADVVFGSRSA